MNEQTRRERPGEISLELCVSNKIITEPSDIDNAFNNYFSTIDRTVSQIIPYTANNEYYLRSINSVLFSLVLLLLLKLRRLWIK